MLFQILGGVALSQERSIVSPELEIQQTDLDIDINQLQNEEFLQTKKGKIFRLTTNSIPEEFTITVSQFSDEKRQAFHKNRHLILKKFAALLATQKVTFGFGVAVKNRIVSLTQKTQYQKQTFSDLGQGFAEKMLSALNQKMWKASNEIANSRNVFFELTPTLQIIGSAPLRLGGALGLTFILGFNFEKESMFWDIQSHIEKFKSGFAFYLGPKVTAGISFDSSKEEKPVQQDIYFPLAVPVWKADGNGLKSFGLSFGLTLPFPPVGGLFNYVNTSHRVSVRNTLNEFLRLSQQYLTLNFCKKLF